MCFHPYTRLRIKFNNSTSCCIMISLTTLYPL
jgi:hypothetical protein